MEKLSQLLDVKDRWEKEEARKAFVAAMAEFKRNPPEVLKTQTVDFTTGRGRTHYKFANLGTVAPAVGSSLADYGLHYDWRTIQAPGGVTVTCVLTHRDGHSEQTSLTALSDDSGNKNSIQQIGSTITYLQRYTLMAITGLAAQDTDDDGAAAPTRQSSAKEQPSKERPDYGTW